MRRRYRRSQRYGRNFLLGHFYLNLGAQYTTTIISAIVLAALVFSGFLIFRYADSADLVARGKRQLQEGKVAWASRTFQALVSRYPEHYQGYLLLGQAYLEMNEREKAEQAFQTALYLRTHGKTDQLAPKQLLEDTSVAVSKLYIAQKKFKEAEEDLLGYAKSHPDDVMAKDALVSLYRSWGEYLVSDKQEYAEAVDRFEKAIRFCREYQTEDQLKTRLVEVIALQADVLEAEQDFSKVIAVLKKSLKYRYLPNTLIAIAEAYEKSKEIDQAIQWYRRAFDADPEIISIKLSNMLIQRGRMLLAERNQKEADAYFKEADQVSRLAKIPLTELYPVSTHEVSLTYKMDSETGHFQPSVSVTFQNDGVRNLSFLVSRVTFYSGDDPLSEKVQVVASPEVPLEAGAADKTAKKLVLTSDKSLHINQLEGSRLRMKLEIAYKEGKEPDWQVKALQDIRVSIPVAEPASPPGQGQPV